MRPDLGLLDVHVHGGVRLCLLYLHGGGKVGLVSCDGAGRGGGAVSIYDDKSRGNILHGVEIEMVRQWLNHLTRISLPFVVRWSLSAPYKF